MDNQMSNGISTDEASQLLQHALADIDAQSKDADQSKDIDNDPEGAKRAIASFQDALEKGVLKFSPVLAGVQSLASETFAAHNVQPVAGMDQLLQRFDFYLVPFPVTAFPTAGGVFEKVEAQIELDQAAGAVFYSLFPTDEYQTVAQGETHLNLGVDANLKLTASAAKTMPNNPVASGSGQAGANVGGDTGGKLVLGPFNYTLRRPVAISRGEGDVQALWRLDSNQKIEGSEPLQFIAVVQVPKGTTSLQARGHLRGFLKANLGAQMGDYFRALGQKLKALFGGEQPLQPDPMFWQNILAAAQPVRPQQ